MLQLKFATEKRYLDLLPIYPLTEKKSRWKSCFVDDNRPDTIQPAYLDLEHRNEDEEGS